MTEGARPATTASDPTEDEFLVLTDESDVVVGYERKGRVHDGEGLLHRAFSIFLFDGEGRILLQKRSAAKRLWPGHWSNSCCGHPRRGESLDLATARRLREELGLEAALERLFSVNYRFRYGDAGSEHEVCSVLRGKLTGEPRPDPREVAEWRLATPEDVTRSLKESAAEHTPWFTLEWKILLERYPKG